MSDDVELWLKSLSLKQYHSAFLNNGYNDIRKCMNLTESDLDKISVTLPGHRKRILARCSIGKTAFEDLSDSCPDYTQVSTNENDNENDRLSCSSPYENLEMEVLPALPPKISKIPVCKSNETKDSIQSPTQAEISIDPNEGKRPVPLPRKSLQVLAPKPRPRTKTVINLCGITENSTSDSLITSQDDSTADNVKSSDINLHDTIDTDKQGGTTDDMKDLVLHDYDRNEIQKSSLKQNPPFESDVQINPDVDCFAVPDEKETALYMDAAEVDIKCFELMFGKIKTPTSLLKSGESCTQNGISENFYDEAHPIISDNNDDSNRASYDEVWNFESGGGVGREIIKSDASVEESDNADKMSVNSSLCQLSPKLNPCPFAPLYIPSPFETSFETKAPIPSRIKSNKKIKTEISDSSPPPIPARKPSNSRRTNHKDDSSPVSPFKDNFGSAVDHKNLESKLHGLSPIVVSSTSNAHNQDAPSFNRNFDAPLPTSPVTPLRRNFDALLPPSPVTPLRRNFDAPLPASPVALRTPPAPPPKLNTLEKESIFSATRATYGFEQDVDNEEPDDRENVAFAESDDTLSDGGEFYDIAFRRPCNEILRESIPIIPASQTKITNRKGFLYKLFTSKKKLSKLGSQWQKRWVVLDGQEMKYYSSNKSFVSRRIIPVCTMINVEHAIKPEVHKYQFKLSTVDRVYTFATDDSDDMSMWTSIIMRGIIENKSGNFLEGGEMNSPDIEGYVRMEGAKSKRYLVIKKAKFCVYNTLNDFKAFTPIYRVEMQLASVKDIGKCKLQIHTPHVAFVFLFETQDDITRWKDVFEESICHGLGDDSIIKDVYENHSNRSCADCHLPNPEWASVSFGITLCKYCAGVHRSLSGSKIRSLRMDSKVWKPSVIQLMNAIGNDNANNFWEWSVNEKDRISKNADLVSRREFILKKYSRREFCQFHPLHGDQIPLNEALCKSVQYGDILETMQLLYSGAEINCTNNENKTPTQIAKESKQTLQEEFLYQNGGDFKSIMTSMNDASLRNSSFCHRGFLYKTGSNIKSEFLKRWCILENGSLSYFDNDKSAVANDSINKEEMLSVSISSDDRLEFTFEVGTTKQSGRVFLFAAETAEDRLIWMNKLAKSIASNKMEKIETIKDLDCGGIVFLRFSSTSDWINSWIHLKNNFLYVFNKKDEEFEELDLRKSVSIGFRKLSEKCLDAFDEGPPMMIGLRDGRALYIQSDVKRETESWHNLIQKVMQSSDWKLINQPLTTDNVPVTVDKCINFIATFGMKCEGIYRINGQHSKVTRLLESFASDARTVQIKTEEYDVHEVANALKRFFRSLDEPLLTTKLYPKWTEYTSLSDLGSKCQWFKYLLTELPLINYSTLKRLITHIARVAEFESENKMSSINLASIFGPILMNVDKSSKPTDGYGTTNLEICVIRDLIDNHCSLFEVKDEELEQEKRIEEAMKKIEQLNNAEPPTPTLLRTITMKDVLIGVYIESRSGDVISLKDMWIEELLEHDRSISIRFRDIRKTDASGSIRPSASTAGISLGMRARELQTYVAEKAKLDLSGDIWSVFEVICNGEMERPLHYNESIIEITKKWASWPPEFCCDCYLCLKPNYIYKAAEASVGFQMSLFCELRYSGRAKKNFKKYCFEFSKYCLSYHRNSAKVLSPDASWNVEDLIIYMGTQKSRNPPTEWCFSYISIDEKLIGPYFGYTVCCTSEDELMRWVVALVRAQHPEGLLPAGSQPIDLLQSTGSASSHVERRMSPPTGGGGARQPKNKITSMFQKYMK